MELPVSGLGFDITTTPTSSIEKHSFSDKILTVGIINSFNTAIEKPQECINQVDEINAKTKLSQSQNHLHLLNVIPVRHSKQRRNLQ